MDDITTNTPPLAPEDRLMVNEIIGNIMSSRQDFLERLMDPRKDVYKECGWPTTAELTPERLQDLYDRDAIAARVVEVFPLESWQVQPDIFEDDDEDNETDFELAFAEIGNLLKPEKSYFQDNHGNPLWEALLRADILSNIGQYGIILLGINDGLPLSQAVKGVIEAFSDPMVKPGETSNKGANASPGAQYGQTDQDFPVTNEQRRYTLNYDEAKQIGEESRKAKKESGKEGRRLGYIRTFPQAQAQVTQWESNRTSPRYGHPIMYLVTFNDYRDNQGMIGAPMSSVNVHWTRVIHLIGDCKGSSEVVSRSILQQVINHVLDAQKVYGASAEGFWQAGLPTVSLETHPQLGGDVKVNRVGLQSMMENVKQGLQKSMVLMGMSAKTLPPSVTDPTPHIKAAISAICIKLGIPERVFMGSERGELASSQDDDAWNDRLKQRQHSRISPRIIAPLIDRLINLGVLPEPKGYSIKWPDLTSQSDQDKAAVGLSMTQALAAYVSGGVNAMVTEQDYLVGIMGFERDEVEQWLEAAAKAAEDQLVEDEALAAEHGMQPIAPPGFEHPAPPPQPGMPPAAGGKPPGGKPPFPPKGGPAKPPPKPPKPVANSDANDDENQEV